MRWLHLTITVGLAVAVAILAVLLVRQQPSGGNPTHAEPAVTVRKIERVPDAELALRRLDYMAWVFRWSGGMIDGEYRTGNGAPPIQLNGRKEAHDLLDRANRRAKSDGLAAPDLDSISGMLTVIVGPIPNGYPQDVPCRMSLFREVGTESDNTITDFRVACFGSPELVTKEFLANPFVRESGKGYKLEVFGKLMPQPFGRSTDKDSIYTMLQLRWVTEEGKD